jgi:hypothetical protein
MSEAPPHRPFLPVVPGYRVEGVLDRGGFGTVLAALDAEGRRVALKVAASGDAVAAGQLSREVTALRAVGSRFAPGVFGTGTLSSFSIRPLCRSAFESSAVARATTSSSRLRERCAMPSVQSTPLDSSIST